MRRFDNRERLRRALRQFHQQYCLAQLLSFLTSGATSVRSTVAAVEFDASGHQTFLSDWQLIDRVNSILSLRTFRRDPSAAPSHEKDLSEGMVPLATSLVTDNLAQLDVSFVVPEVQLIAMICPSSMDAAAEE